MSLYDKYLLIHADLPDQFCPKLWAQISNGGPEKFTQIRRNILKVLQGSRQLHRKYWQRFYNNEIKLQHWATQQAAIQANIEAFICSNETPLASPFGNEKLREALRTYNEYQETPAEIAHFSEPLVEFRRHIKTAFSRNRRSQITIPQERQQWHSMSTKNINRQTEHFGQKNFLSSFSQVLKEKRITFDQKNRNKSIVTNMISLKTVFSQNETNGGSGFHRLLRGKGQKVILVNHMGKPITYMNKKMGDKQLLRV